VGTLWQVAILCAARRSVIHETDYASGVNPEVFPTPKPAFSYLMR
jgi:hypothetical protein